MADLQDARDALYEEVTASFGAAIQRLARGYEGDPDRRRDLIQEIHVALWRSLGAFQARCSLRTWVYRVAHNTATSLVLRRRTSSSRLVSLEEVAAVPAAGDPDRTLDRHLALERLTTLIRMLKPMDREVILLYLDGLDAASIAEIVGLSPGNVATKVHRIKAILRHRFHEGPDHGAR